MVKINFNSPIQVNLFDFFTKGIFDYIKLGQSKEWILNNFPDPDFTDNHKNSANIWQYGDIEFHFSDNKLHLIFCEKLKNLTAGNSIVLDKWFLKDYDKLNLSYVIELLNNQSVNYCILHKVQYGYIQLHILPSQVCLHFEPVGDERNPNKYFLFNFAKSLNKSC